MSTQTEWEVSSYVRERDSDVWECIRRTEGPEWERNGQRGEEVEVRRDGTNEKKVA